MRGCFSVAIAGESSKSRPSKLAEEAYHGNRASVPLNRQPYSRGLQRWTPVTSAPHPLLFMHLHGVQCIHAHSQTPMPGLKSQGHAAGVQTSNQTHMPSKAPESDSPTHNGQLERLQPMSSMPAVERLQPTSSMPAVAARRCQPLIQPCPRLASQNACRSCETC